VLIACVAAGLAQVGYAETVHKFEFTPFYGYRFGGDFEDAETGADFDIDSSPAWGGIFNVGLSELTQFEFYYSHQETELESSDALFEGRQLCDLDVDYYHVGGTYILTTDAWQPFVVGTLGATHLSPDASGSDSLTRFSVGIGGGVRWFPREHFGLYLAGRALFTFIGSDTSIHIENGETTIHFRSDGLTQVELQAGLIFAF
jgi:hypothetical protein